MIASTLSMIATYGFKTLQVLPLLLSVLNEAVEAIEAIGGSGTGPQKKEALMEAVAAAYDLQSLTGQMPVGREDFMALADSLGETVLRLQKARHSVADAWDRG